MLVNVCQKLVRLAFSSAVSLWLASLVINSKVYAFSTYAFDFTLPHYTLRDGQELTAHFTWDIQNFTMTGQHRLIVKPFITAGAVEIYNENLAKFVGLADITSAYPYLQPDLRVKFSGVQGLQTPALVHFDILDLLTGQKYETQARKVWGTSYYATYTKLLNEQILTSAASASDSVKPVLKSITATSSAPPDPLTLYVWYLSPALFLYGLIKSAHGFG